MGRRSTAYHEAGHAVIGRVLGLVCGDVTIVPNADDGELGHSIIADPWATHWQYERAAMEAAKQGSLSFKYRTVQSVFRARIISTMAGAESEAVLLDHSAVGDGHDRHEIERMAAAEADLTDDLWERYEPRMRRQTRRLVRKHRDKIERVAIVLLECGTLTGDEIDALMER